jgi:hypothetical protein
METHTRYQVDGAHLFITQYENTKDKQFLKSAKHALTFLVDKLIDPLDEDAFWIVHDSRERPTEDSINKAPFSRSSTNSLCLNTHVWAMSALHRFTEITSDGAVGEALERAWKGLQKIINLDGFKSVYSLPFHLRARILRLCASKSRGSRVLQAYDEIWKRILSPIQRQYPRLRMPTSYLERAATTSTFSDFYFLLNIKDLLVLYMFEHREWLEEVIRSALDLAFSTDIPRYLTNHDSRTSIVLEVLYLAVSIFDDYKSEWSDYVEIFRDENFLYPADILSNPIFPNNHSQFSQIHPSESQNNYQL